MKTNEEANQPESERIEKRGRKPAKDPMQEVKLWINNSIICGGETKDNKSHEYLIALDDFKRKVTEYIYSELTQKDSPLRIAKREDKTSAKLEYVI